MSQHILYCNDNADVLVLDLPASIAHAQASTRRLCSAPALEVPYLTPEPKGAKRDALLSATPAAESEYHKDIQYIIGTTLAFLHEKWHEPTWCRPRAIPDKSQISVESKCHQRHDDAASGSGLPPLVLSPSMNCVCCLSAFMRTVVHNPYPCFTELALSTKESFIVPANSTFLCTSIQHGLKSFETAVRCLLPGGLFDLVLLDPPWSNRSVRRSRTYKSTETQLSDPFEQVFPTVNTYLSEKGYLAVWVTNKAGIRAQVLGICQSHGFVLKEEWIWLKVTVRGEPITPLGGIWRKPYEVLLLFRRNSELQEVVRRVGIAVPDVHSRKPSLKSMFEQLLPMEYNALEVFARSLTAGWWSWGDETLKFQHDSQWQWSKSDEEHQTHQAVAALLGKN